MLNALFKAFTGRSGWLGSILALAILALTAYAVIEGLPRVQQRVLTLSQAYLENQMADGDTLMSLQVSGRDVHLGGDIQDPAALKAGLESLGAVRRVVLIGAAAPVASVEPSPVMDVKKSPESIEPRKSILTEDTSENLPETTAQVVEPVTDPVLGETESEINPAEVVPESVSADPMPAADTPAEPVDIDSVDAAIVVTESSLKLRYDGTRLKLSGHVGDDQMASLLADAVRRVIPEYSELEAEVLGDGQPSSLNWMNSFLRLVSGLPQDAQGVILGSDSQGVNIVPDTEQALRPQAEAVNAVRETDPARLDAAPPVIASEAVTDAPSQAAEQPIEAEVEPTSPGSDQAVVTPAVPSDAVPITSPPEFISYLNQRLSERMYFQPGAVWLDESLKVELLGLAEMLRQSPSVLLRITGNIDASVGPEFEDLVGMDRAMEVQQFLSEQQIDRSRIFVAPLPRGYAFDKRVQLVFYISE